MQEVEEQEVEEQEPHEREQGGRGQDRRKQGLRQPDGDERQQEAGGERPGSSYVIGHHASRPWRSRPRPSDPLSQKIL